MRTVLFQNPMPPSPQLLSIAAEWVGAVESEGLEMNENIAVSVHLSLNFNNKELDTSM